MLIVYWPQGSSYRLLEFPTNIKYSPWGNSILGIPLTMIKFFLFLRHRDFESDVLTAGKYKEEGVAIWKTFKDKFYSRSSVGVRKLRETAPNRLLAETHTAGYEAAYHSSQVSASWYTNARVKANSLHVSILCQTVLSIKTKLNTVALVRERTIPTERPPPVGEVSANFCG